MTRSLCMDNNVYAQIGVVLLVARLRFRPILMTSFAFILSVYPLVVADAAEGIR